MPIVLTKVAFRHLAFFNFVVDREILKPHLPKKVEVDLENGEAYVSLVALVFEHQNKKYCQVNLRFYVKRKAKDGTHRGVVFLKEVVPDKFHAILARMGGEQYQVFPTSHEISFEPGGKDGQGRPILDGVAKYQWGHDDNKLSAQIRTVGLPQPVGFSPLEQFISHRLYSYRQGPFGFTLEHRLQHVEWFYWDVEEFSLDGDFKKFYGEKWGSLLSQKPESVFFSKGGPVSLLLPRLV